MQLANSNNSFQTNHSFPMDAGLTSKMALLDSSAARVKKQNIALRRLLQDSNYFQSLEDIVRSVSDSQARLHHLKQKESHAHSSSSSSHDRSTLIHVENRIKKLQQELQLVRDMVNEWEFQQKEAKKPEHQLGREVIIQKKNDEKEIQRMSGHVNRFLSALESTRHEKERLEEYSQVAQILSHEASSYGKDLAADIGLLYCELEYLKELEMRPLVAERLRGLNQLAIQSEMGKIEGQMLQQQTLKFISQCEKRLLYQTNILLYELNNMIQCLSLTHSRPGKLIGTQNEQKIKLLQQRLKSIKQQKRGMELKESQQSHKLKRVCKKLRQLTGKEWDLGLAQESRREGELESNIKECEGAWAKLISLRQGLILHK